MIDTILRARLNPALRRNRHRRALLAVAAVWLLVAIAAGVLIGLRQTTGQEYPLVWVWLLPTGLVLSGLAALAAWAGGSGLRGIAGRIEQRHPDLDGRLLTAVEQKRDDEGALTVMQERLLEETVRHSTQRRWSAAVPDAAIFTSRAVLIVAVLAAAALWWSIRPQPAGDGFFATGIPVDGQHENGVTVSPGSTELEKGTALVVLARFDEPPTGADLVIGESAESERRIPMVRSMNDPVFGVTVPDVAESFTYRVEFAGRRSADYRVTVFEYPSLERSDVAIVYPDYTGLPPKKIEDTRRISVVEGSQVSFELQLNKPVASAVLEATGDGGDSLVLQPAPDRAIAELREHRPGTSREYRLILTDSDGRKNRKPDLFSIDVLPNRVPELKFVRPRGDLQPSPIEEIEFEATVLDDFGVHLAGLTIERPGSESLVLELGRDLPAGAVHTIRHLLRLEEMNAAPAHLISWHLWADDTGPDGKVRRTYSDLFFAEVRPFEQIFRQASGAQQEQGGQQAGGGAAAEAERTQKDIVNATWKLQRSAPAQPNDAYRSDVNVIADSQDEVRSRTEELGGNDPESAVHVRRATAHMERASGILRDSMENPARLKDAIAEETAAYQALLKLAAREFQVSRQRGQQGSGQTGDRQQMQLDEMDLADDERRYETQRQAESPENAARREANQILSRLQELAKRQEDVNERLKELQSALQEAKTQEEREAAERELKRLEEEQRQMLADVDELQQRMDRASDQAAMSDQRESLSEARGNMQEAAEAVREGQPGQAAASGTRAQRQMQEMREDLRRRMASGLADDLRQLRTDARDLARRQEELTQALQQQGGETPRSQPQSLSGGETADGELSPALDRQRAATQDIVRRTEALSEETGSSEPLLSRQLYDAARKFATDDAGAVKEMQQQMLREGQITQQQFDRMKEIMESEESGKALTITSELLEDGLQQEAVRTAQRGGEAAEELRRNVERAASGVIGDDTAALQAAAAELESVTRELEREMEEAGGRAPGSGREPSDPQSGEGSDAGSGQQGRSRQEGGRGEGAGRDGESPDGSGPQNQPGDAQNGEGGEEEGQEGEGRDGEGSRYARNDSGGQSGDNQPGRAPGSGEQESPAGQEGEQSGGEGQAQAEGQGQGQGQGSQPGGDPSGEDSGGEPGEGRGGQGGGRRGSLADSGRNGGQSGEQNGGAEGDEDGDGIIDFGGNEGSRQAGGRGGRGGSGVREAGNRSGGPITGEGFTEWTDRLRDIEDMIDYTDLRTGVATARERARQMRIDVKRDLKKPDWALVELEIVKPLLEVRQRVREELLRRSSEDAMVPIDRDPVPGRYTELVERYYEELAR